jgi:hypothetical protein
MNEVEIIKQKVRLGTATISDLVKAISKDQYMLFNALMDNNLEDVNVTLRMDLGNAKNLPVVADRRAMTAVISSYIQSSNQKALQKIIDEFDFNPKAGNYTVKVLPMLKNGGPDPLARSFADGAGEVGSGIGNFLGPIFGSLGTDTATTTTTKPSNTTTYIIIGVLVVLAVAGYFIFVYKSPKAAA